MQASSNENIRGHLLSYVPWFVGEAGKIAGVKRIALLGSITTGKTNPKDIDFLVTVDDDVDLEPLARLGRQLKVRGSIMANSLQHHYSDTGNYLVVPRSDPHVF